MSNQLAVTNYDKIKALAYNAQTIERFAGIMGSKRGALSYISSAMLAVANSPTLMECTPSSVFNSVMRAAALNLSCDPSTKQAHIVAYNNNKKGVKEAQFIPGYVGLNQMAHRTGKYRYLNVSELYEGQRLEVNQLTGASRIEGKRTGNTVLGYFHYFELFNGFSHIKYMTVEELRAHGERYAKYNPMWKSDFPAMAKKTVTRLHLTHDGILNPHDKEILNEMADEHFDGEALPGEIFDGTFNEQDDESAAADAAQRKIDEANAPKRDNNEMLAEFGFEPPAPKPAAAPAQHAPIVPPAEMHADIVDWPADFLQEMVIEYKANHANQIKNALKGSCFAPADGVNVAREWMAVYKEMRNMGADTAQATEYANAHFDK